MASKTVVKVKRACTNEPLEAFILSAKRRKQEESEEDESVNTVFKFAGTVKTDEDNVHSEVSKAVSNFKDELKDAARKTHTPKIQEKLRENAKSKWAEDRYKVVNLYRYPHNNEEGCSKDEITIVEIEEADNSEEIETLGRYEYDLYYVEHAADFCPGILDSIVSVQPCELVNEAELSDEEQTAGADITDNEDDENNWRNDYPDEQSDDDEEADDEFKDYRRRSRDIGYYDEDDELLNRMEKFGIGSGDELSSDSDADDLIYGRDESPFERYKSRIRNEFVEDDPELSD